MQGGGSTPPPDGPGLVASRGATKLLPGRHRAISSLHIYQKYKEPIYTSSFLFAFACFWLRVVYFGNMRITHHLIGKRFGKLVVRCKAPGAPHGKYNYSHYWLCDCDCGYEVWVRYGGLHNGTKSCGCLPRGRKPTGRRLDGHPLYSTWAGMKDRCSNPNSPSYKNYGGRGIRVCKRWRESFPTFLEDMGPKPPGTSIDRIDNNKGYFPGNCRWATQKEQVLNRRNTLYLTYQGEEVLADYFVRQTGVPANWAYVYGKGLTGEQIIHAYENRRPIGMQGPKRPPRKPGRRAALVPYKGKMVSGVFLSEELSTPLRTVNLWIHRGKNGDQMAEFVASGEKRWRGVWDTPIKKNMK